MRTKRTKITAVSEIAKTLNAAGKKILPPNNFDLEADDIISFDKIIAEFAKVEWTDHTLEMAAALARSITDLRYAQRQLREEGPTIVGAKGGLVINPVINAMKSQAGIVFAMRRSLALQAREKSGETHNLAKRRSIEKGIEARIEDDDDLIASPHRHDEDEASDLA